MERARQAGLGITAHSGLNTDAERVRRTLRVLRPDRLGHGLRLLDDEALVREVRRAGPLLELSPTSNWITASVPSLEEHPLPRLARAGVTFSLNTDDPHLFGIDLTHEYGVARGCTAWGPGTSGG